MEPFTPSLAGATAVSRTRLIELSTSVQSGSDHDVVYIGGGRVARAPSARLSRVLKDVHLRYLVPRYEPVALAHVHGYRADRGIVSNALPHLGADIVLSIDVRKFFQNISRDAVRNSLAGLDTTPRDQDILLDLTFVGEHLPLGFQTSPVLSNIAFHLTDTALAEYAASRGLTVSRYADDISISGPGLGNGTLDDARDLLEEHGWSLNSRKTRFLRTGRRQYVTGVYVGDSSLRAPRAIKRAIRAQIYAIQKVGWVEFFSREGNPTLIALLSKIAHVGVIEKEVGDDLRKRLLALAPPTVLPPSEECDGIFDRTQRLEFKAPDSLARSPELGTS